MKSLIAAALAASLVISFSAQAADNAANAAANELNQSIDIDTTSLEKTSPFETPSPTAPEAGGKAFRDAPIETPAIIPHDISQYHITPEANACLNCHGYTHRDGKQVGLPYTMPKSHFHMVNGEEQVSADRYPCLICHRPQTNTEPLVGTTDVDHQ